MNITLLSNRDIASNLALNYLYTGLQQRHKLTVRLSARVGTGKAKPQALQDLAFMEQGLFNQLLFPALNSRQSPVAVAVAVASKQRLLSFDDFRRLGVDIEDISSVNCPEGLANIRNCQPDVILSIRFGLILKPAVLAIPRLGVINLHSGKLPEYRGVMATFRAMLAGEQSLSTTLHYISDGSIDTGETIATHTVAVDQQASYLANCLNLYKGGVDSIIEAVERLAQGGTLASQPQTGQGNYFSFPDDQELAQFFAKGYKLFDYAELIQLGQKYI
jgi:methionyl-tRNA formyltransferase